jgi:hypothetical protein
MMQVMIDDVMMVGACAPSLSTATAQKAGKLHALATLLSVRERLSLSSWHSYPRITR